MMPPDDRLTAAQLGIDDATRQHMDDAWTAYRTGLAPDSEAQQELFAEWAALDADMGEEAYEQAAEQRPGDLDFDPLTRRSSCCWPPCVKDADLTEAVGPLLPADVFEDPGERELYTARISTGEDVRLSAQAEYLAECLRVYAVPEQWPTRVAHQLLTGTRT